MGVTSINACHGQWGRGHGNPHPFIFGTITDVYYIYIYIYIIDYVTQVEAELEYWGLRSALFQETSIH